MLRCTQSAIQGREWTGHAANGRSYSVEQIHIFRMQNGQIAEHWAVRDDLGMFRQLGFI